MNYKEAIDYLYNATPLFQKIGAAAYKPGLETAKILNLAFEQPDRSFRSIHIAGTNGKGSTCHMIASILQRAGYKVGLYTSPHLIDFRERIKVNGQIISENAVVEFLSSYIEKNLDLHPSFFELTTIMAFDYFRSQQVDIAIIETGLGGRLDTTNIISPLLSVITNISKDHIAQLGNSLESIAKEKAGIMKANVPVIIGNSGTKEINEVFQQKAKSIGTDVIYANQNYAVPMGVENDRTIYISENLGQFETDLSGNYQKENINTVLEVIGELRKQQFDIPDSAIYDGLANVCKNTNFCGRWMKLNNDPLMICDTGHNLGGWQYLSEKLKDYSPKLIMIIGFVNDKDVSGILSLMPKNASYIFCNANIPRAMDAHKLKEIAGSFGIQGRVVPNVHEAYLIAKEEAKQENAVVFIGGSTFVVADLLSAIKDSNNNRDN